MVSKAVAAATFRSLLEGVSSTTHPSEEAKTPVTRNWKLIVAILILLVLAATGGYFYLRKSKKAS